MFSDNEQSFISGSDLGAEDYQTSSFRNGVADIGYGAVAIGASTFMGLANGVSSLFTGEDIASTSRALRNIGFDESARFARRHDTITEMGGLIGGFVSGGGLAVIGLKAMKAAGKRTGTGTWLHPELAQDKLVKIAASKGRTSAEFVEARRTMMLQTFGGSIAEGAVAETIGALAAAGNPMMDDYEGMDWVIGAALGGAFGAFASLHRKRKLERALDTGDKAKGEFLGRLNTMEARMDWNKGSKLAFYTGGLGMVRQVTQELEGLAHSDDAVLRQLSGDTEIKARLAAYDTHAKASILTTVDELMGSTTGTAQKAMDEGTDSFELAIVQMVSKASDNGEVPFAHVASMTPFVQADIPDLVIKRFGDFDVSTSKFKSKILRKDEGAMLEFVKTQDKMKFAEKLRATGKYSEHGIRNAISEVEELHMQGVFDRASGTFISAGDSLSRASLGDVGDISGMYLGRKFEELPPAAAQAHYQRQAKSSPKFKDTDGTDAIEMMRYLSYGGAKATAAYTAGVFKIGDVVVDSYKSMQEGAAAKLLELARDEIEAGGKLANPYSIAGKYGIKPVNAAGERTISKLLSNSDTAEFGVDDFYLAGTDGFKQWTSPRLMRTRGVPLQEDFTRVMSAKLDVELMKGLHLDVVRDTAVKYSSVEGMKVLIDLLDNPMMDDLNGLHKSLTDAEVGSAHVSQDFAVRDLGAAGDAATTLGAIQADAQQRFLKASLTPLADPAEAAMKSEADGKVLSEGIAALRTAAPKEGEYIDLVPYNKEGGLALAILTREGGGEVVEWLMGTNKAVATPLPDVVSSYFLELRTLSSKMLDMQNAVREMQGLPAEKGIGLRIPARDLSSKQLGYVVREATGAVELLVADTAEGLAELVADANKLNGVRAMDRFSAGINSKWDRQVELGLMKTSDLNKSRTSIKHLETEDVFPTVQEVQTMANRELESNFRRLMETGLDHLIQPLQRASDARGTLTRQQPGYEELKESLLHEATPQSKLINIMLNRKQSAPVVSNMYNRVEELLDHGLGKLQDTTGSMKQVVTGAKWRQGTDADKMEAFNEAVDLGKGVDLTNSIVLNETAEAQRWKSSQLVATSNNVASLAALRFGEVSHGILNVLSAPVLLLGELQNAARRGTNPSNASVFDSFKAITAGVQTAFGYKNKEAMAYFAKYGITDARVHEVNETIAAASLREDTLAKLEHKGWFKAATYVSQRSETFTREVAAATAWNAFQKMYPEKGMEDSLAFVSSFVNKTMGNYVTSQRPAMFHGTIGSAVGLFQTYSVTMLQNMAKNLEDNNIAAFSAMMGTQAGMFGMGSLPGFDAVTDVIASNMSEEHKTFETAIHEGLGGLELPGGASAADVLMYGVPSAYTQTSFFTRGETTPRLPFSFAEGSPLPSITPAGLTPYTQALQGTLRMWDGLRNGQDVGTTVLSAMQMQTLSRPMARMADMAQGYAVDGAGRTVDAHASPMEAAGTATFARLVGARPLKEQLLRQTLYQNSHYGSIDSGSRKHVTSALRQAAREETLTDARAEELLTSYLARGGTSEGFTAAINEAIEFSSPEHRMDFRKIIGNDNPLNWILNSAL